MKSAQPRQSRPGHVFMDLKQFEILIKQNDRSERRKVTESLKFLPDNLATAYILGERPARSQTRRGEFRLSFFRRNGIDC